MPQIHDTEHTEQASAPSNPSTGTWRFYFKPDGLYYLEDDGTETGPLTATPGGAGTDTTAIHDDAASEISAIAEKTAPVDADMIVIEDSADSNNKKMVQLGNLPKQTGEIMLSAAGGWPSTTGGCADNAKNEYGTNDIDLYSLDFDPDTDEYAQWSVWMPDDWDGGTVTAKFAWSAATGSGDVIWGLQGRSYANDDVIDAAWGTAQTVTDTLTATGDMCYSGVTSAITLAGTPAAGEFVQFRVYRDADNGSDTMTGDAEVLAIEIKET